MHLVRCSTPQEPLEDAPTTALLADHAEGEVWAGFWSADVYYVRCTGADGSIAWFKVADEERSAIDAEPRVLALRPQSGAQSGAQSRVSVVVAQSPDGRRMLVGGSVRRSAR